MALLLHIETATDVCSVALSRDGKAIALREEGEGRNHALLLTGFIQEILDAQEINLEDLDAIVISQGPGSYTGLRIGAATAKGLCYSSGKPLIAINTLQSMACVAAEKFSGLLPRYLCPMIDARRMEVYTAVFNSNLEFIRPTEARILDDHSFADFMEHDRVLFFGDGLKKALPLLKMSGNAVFMEDFTHSATGLTNLAEKAYNSGQFADPAYFEPFYLKDFFTGGQPPKG